MNALLVTIMVTGNGVVAVYVAVAVFQSTERSRYRYRMWQIRDEVVDAVRQGDFQMDKAVISWIEDTELMITATDWMTPFRYLEASRAHRRSGVSLEPHSLIPTSAETREYLEKMTDQARAARMRLLFFGSSSGWLLAAGAPLIARTVAKDSLAHLRECEAESGLDHLKIEHPNAEAVRIWSTQKYGSPVAVFSDVRTDRRELAYA
jgi:hypothetical protein